MEESSHDYADYVTDEILRSGAAGQQNWRDLNKWQRSRDSNVAPVPMV
jgi:hypothetical protein